MSCTLGAKLRVTAVVFLSALAVSGCVTAPATINEMSYSELDAIGAMEQNSACRFLEELHGENKKIMRGPLLRMVESCEKTTKLAKYTSDQNREKEEQERQRQEERAKEQARMEERDREIRAAEARRKAAYEESLEIIKDRINSTQVAKQLDPDISDDLVNSTMTVDPNFSLPNLKRVLACSELRFNATGADVNLSGHNLSVSFKEASTSTGVKTLTMNFRKTENFWLMTSYEQGVLSFAGDRRKSFMIAESNAYSECGWFPVMQNILNK